MTTQELLKEARRQQLLHAIAARVKLPGKPRKGDARLVVKRLESSAGTLLRREASRAQSAALAGRGKRKPPKPSARSKAAGSKAYRPDSSVVYDGSWIALLTELGY